LKTTELKFKVEATKPRAPAARRNVVIRLMRGIARHEGWDSPGSLVRRLHNPGALTYANQPNATPGIRGFAAFDSDESGWAALRRDLDAKARLRWTLRTTMEHWCGGCYLNALVRETGLDADSTW